MFRGPKVPFCRSFPVFLGIEDARVGKTLYPEHDPAKRALTSLARIPACFSDRQMIP